MIDQFKQSGALFIGTTANDSLVHHTSNHDTTGNPHDWDLPNYFGGAAGAIASGIGHVALASDEAGSVRIGAALTGTVGLKPRSGMTLVRRDGSRLSFGFGNIADGFIARSVDDCAIALDIASNSQLGCFEAIIGVRKARRWAGDPLKIAWFSQLPHTLYIQDPQITEKFETCMHQLVGVFNLLSPKVTFTQLEKAWDSSHASLVTRSIVDLFNDYDFIITPTLASFPWNCIRPHETNPDDRSPSIEKDHESWNPYSFPFNWSDHAAISIPCGHVRSDRPLPIGMQIVAKAQVPTTYDDHAQLLSFASLLEYYINIPLVYRPCFCSLRYAFKTRDESYL